ncbi:CotH kinase family protein, partial [Myxococcota bacterium]|nr:CotH kinase family protein [Myxococcota bacterium]
NINNVNNTNETLQTPDWTELTHGNSADPDYDVVFPKDQVLRLDITIAPDQWELMQDDLEENLGNLPGGPGPVIVDFDPIFVPCSVFFNGLEWYKVGIRYKGNSSLTSPYSQGIEKLPLKLDFDEFEDTWPQIKNQRFYGFKQVSLKNNFADEALVREKVAGDLFMEFGLVGASTSFAVLYVDHGQGPQYYGVYTLVEEVDDTVVTEKFEKGGNLYKPEDDAATFAEGTFDGAEMQKEDDDGDYADVEQLYTLLHSATRTSDEAAWKSSLEQIFDVDVFLRWLAAGTVMQNWDSYGVMPHNYYLYNDPQTSRLTWIPWDHNETLMEGKMGGALSLSLSEVTSAWPLIRYLMDVEEYALLYEAYMEEFITDSFAPAKMITTYTAYYNLLAEHAHLEADPYTFIRTALGFDNAIEELKSHVQARTDAVTSLLGL